MTFLNGRSHVPGHGMPASRIMHSCAALPVPTQYSQPLNKDSLTNEYCSPTATVHTSQSSKPAQHSHTPARKLLIPLYICPPALIVREAAEQLLRGFPAHLKRIAEMLGHIPGCYCDTLLCLVLVDCRVRKQRILQLH